MAKKRKKGVRILEIYCSRKPKSVRHPWGGYGEYEKAKMTVAGNCVVMGVDGKVAPEFGAGTVKLIPVDPRDLRAIADVRKRELRKRKKRRR